MTKTSHRGRPLCRDERCSVEITAEEKYCAAHHWQINTWLEKSRAALQEYKRLARQKAV